MSRKSHTVYSHVSDIGSDLDNFFLTGWSTTNPLTKDIKNYPTICSSTDNANW